MRQQEFTHLKPFTIIKVEIRTNNQTPPQTKTTYIQFYSILYNNRKSRTHNVTHNIVNIFDIHYSKEKSKIFEIFNITRNFGSLLQ